MSLAYLQKLKEQEKNVPPLTKQSETPQAKHFPHKAKQGESSPLLIRQAPHPR